jgi:hypothetical protein
MDIEFRDTFIEKWHAYFGDAELPIAMRYADEMPAGAQPPARTQGPHRCVVDALNQIRLAAASGAGAVAGAGTTAGAEAATESCATIAFSRDTIRCGGGMRYLGYVDNFDAYQKHIEKFLVETEHYKDRPETVRAYFQSSVSEFRAPGRYCVFTRWDALTEDDNPELVIFFATPDELSGLVGLANYDRTDAHGVVCPWGSGCSSIVLFPYLERQSDDPHAVLGGFDPSARPCMGADELAFTVPFELFKHMVAQMDESFLTTEAWDRVRARMCTSGCAQNACEA